MAEVSRRARVTGTGRSRFTLTAAGFVAAKTAAWGDRNAPRDLYDLWTLSQQHLINQDAAHVFKSQGPTGGLPHRWSFPTKPPTEQAWHDALDHQCILQVTAAEAYRTVVGTWRAVVEAQGREF